MRADSKYFQPELSIESIERNSEYRLNFPRNHGWALFFPFTSLNNHSNQVKI